MPELPEVETMRHGILSIVGARIVDAERTICRRRPIAIAPRIDHFRRRVVGRRVSDVGRVGKRVLVKLDSGDAIVMEPRMTGLILVAEPPTQEHLRFRCRLSHDGNGRAVNGADFSRAADLGGASRRRRGKRAARQVTASDHELALLFWDRRGLGSVRLFSAEELAATFGPKRLGPDALGMTARTFQEQLGSTRRAVKVALLDQRAVAGIGNLYASEILHVACVHPAVRCDRLTGRQWQAVAAATRAVLEEAIRYEGSTLGDGTYRNALNQAGSYQNHHRVYNRADVPCPRCGPKRLVQRIVQAQRSTFFCPGCQRRSSIS